MSTPWNPTDVAPVAAFELCAQIRLADADGTGLAASLSLTELDISRMECMFWRTYAGQASQGHAVFARIWTLDELRNTASVQEQVVALLSRRPISE